ncbi:sugar ABC transporter permease [Streptomyces sp. NBC_00963]|uniref:carbohydrate ABC transporter permease n=1 Tax=Streptomyces sp. NBC_00963 TaxID=2903697 RepID=UPI0038661A40|nr:sugar ABC transporter permease [Streptomyces sp. NBC_00963]
MTITSPPSRTARRPSRRSPRAGIGHFLTFGAPGLLLYLGLVLVPVIMSVRSSLTDENPLHRSTRYTGLANYRELLGDPAFHRALGNTVIVTAIVVVVPNVLGLGVAILLDRRGRLYHALRAVFFTPVVLSSVVVSVIWQALLTDDGMVNSLLRSAGVDHPPGWLSDPSIALYSVASIIAWQMLGFCVVVYLAGVQGVPPELHEAAALDGAGAGGRFRHVTWPMLAPAVTINTVMLLITAFKAYDHIQVITNGGPGDGTTATIAFSVVTTAFTGNRIGYAAAMSTVMLALVAAISVLALRFLQRREVNL